MEAYLYILGALIWGASVAAELSGPQVGPMGLPTVKLEPANLTLETEPYIYTLNKKDLHFIDGFQFLQPIATWKQQPMTLVDSLNQSHSYYVNKSLLLADISENELIFYALHAVYQTRIVPYFQWGYEKPEDRRRTVDAKLINEDHCRAQVQYLANKAEFIRQAHARGQSIRHLSPELLSFFDSYASEETGLLLGNNNWLGQFKLCDKRRLFDLVPIAVADSNEPARAEVVDFEGRYCTASLRAPEWEPLIERGIERLEKSHFKYANQRYDYRLHFRIQLGLCLPQTCDSQQLMSEPQLLRKVALLATLRLGEPYASYNLSDIYCTPDESSPYRTELSVSAQVLIATVVVWLSAVALATLADLSNWFGLDDPRRRQIKAPHLRSALQRLILSLSIAESWTAYRHVPKRKDSGAGSHSTGANKPLLTTVAPLATANATQKPTQTCQVSSLYYLDCIKVFLMLSIIWAHSVMAGLMVTRFPTHVASMDPLASHVCYCLSFCVDWFFCLTGIITAYRLFAANFAQKAPAIAWLYAIFKRWWRLAPVYVLLFWFLRSMGPLAGSGPLWDYGTSNTTQHASCRRESWLVPFTLTANFYPIHEECVLPAWYISSDMQFFLVTPLFLVVLARSPILGHLLTWAAIGTSVAGRWYQYSFNPKSRTFDMLRARYDLVQRNNWDLPEPYTRPYYRIPAYLVGLLVGHYVYMVHSGRWQSPLYVSRRVTGARKQLVANGANSQTDDQKPFTRQALQASFLVGGIIWFLSLVLSGWLVFRYLPNEYDKYAHIILPLLYSGSHTQAALACGLIQLAFLTGFLPRLRRLMEHPIWLLLSRLNYCVYLGQLEVLLWFLNNSMQTYDVTLQNTNLLFVAGTVVLYGLALLLTLLLINPLTRLENEFIGILFISSAPQALKQQPQPSEGLTLEQSQHQQRQPFPARARPDTVSDSVFTGWGPRTTVGSQVGRRKISAPALSAG